MFIGVAAFLTEKTPATSVQGRNKGTTL